MHDSLVEELPGPVREEQDKDTLDLLQQSLSVMLWMERRLPKAYLTADGDLVLAGFPSLRDRLQAEINRLKERE